MKRLILSALWLAGIPSAKLAEGGGGLLVP
jgi:hypothetical protein